MKPQTRKVLRRIGDIVITIIIALGTVMTSQTCM